MSILDRLLKSKKEIVEIDESQEVEKSFDEAVEEVNKALKADDKDEKKDEKDEKVDTTDTDVNEDTDEDEEKSEKSIDDDEIFVDAEPIIKSIVKDLTKKIEDLTKTVKEVKTIQKAHAELSTAEAKLLKSLNISGNKIEDRKGVTTTDEVEPKEKEFEKSDDGNVKLTKSEALKRLQDLAKSGKIDSHEVAILEGRINRGGELPEMLLKEDEKEDK